MNTETVTPKWRVIVFAIYSILYEAIIWGIFGWAVFVKDRSGWWVLVAIICSGLQLKPKHFGIPDPVVRALREWMDESEPALPRAPALTESIVQKIQCDALWHAAQNIHDMSRGTKSEDRAAAIDEARDLIADIARNAECGRQSRAARQYPPNDQAHLPPVSGGGAERKA